MKKFVIILLILCVAMSFVGCTILQAFAPDDEKSPGDGGNDVCEHKNLETLEGYASTCTSTGLSDGKKCSSCGEIVQKQETIEKASHSFDSANDVVCNTCGFFNSDLPSFVVSETKAKAGNKNVAVTVSLKNNPGIASIILSLEYDSKHLSLTKIEYNSGIGGQTVQPQTMASPASLYWINAFADTTGDWVFATLYFDVSASAKGEYNIQISYQPNNIYNIQETNLNFKTVQGKLVIG